MPAYPIDAPLVIVHNYLETFREFLTRTGDDSVLMARRFNGDQALFWLGEKKLIISSAPIENSETLSRHWGYSEIETVAPQQATSQLSLDIIREPALSNAIIQYAGSQKAITLVAYAATEELHQLVDYLENTLGLTVKLPETPTREKLWVKNFVDSKAGFRELVTKWVGAEHIPEGYSTTDLKVAAQIAMDFANKEKGVVIKANTGGSGVGNLFLTPPEIQTENRLDQLFEENSFFKNELLVIEEMIPSTAAISPSLEFYVPPLGQGRPVITYLCNQHFESSGRFAGIIISEELYLSTWYPNLQKAGLKIASELQMLGYAGHFDLDAIVDDGGRLYLLEINSRRTGGTFVHEFLTNQFGPDYSGQFTVFSQNKIGSHVHSLSVLKNQLNGLLFNEKEPASSGVIILLTSRLDTGNFGFLVLGESIQEVISTKTELAKRLGASLRPAIFQSRESTFKEFIKASRA